MSTLESSRFGSCDEDDVSSYSSGEQKPCCCCCCYYDPFEDDSPECRIQDLSFALRKLSVMKCQMRKWRLERLQLESQTRSLKAALQTHGVDVDAVLKPDPLLEHLRAENCRLQYRKDELEDELRDLGETLAERERCYDDPCDAVAQLREKTLALRHRHAVEKRQLRETIANLQMRLQKAEEDSSCAALNRLRAKLRELMKDGKKGDQQVSTAAEKSIETSAELSKSCDELRKENERLLAEVETLKKEINENAVKNKGEESLRMEDFEKESGEIFDLSKRVKTCESLVAQMRLQLAEKDDIINDLQKKLYAERRNSTQLEHDLDQMAVSQKALSTEIEAMKAELKEKDEKITKLLRDLRQSTTVALNMSDLESELERLKPEFYQLAANRDQLMDELNKTRRELSERNDQIFLIMEERGKQLAQVNTELERAKLDAETLENENARLKEKLEQSENELKCFFDLNITKDELDDLKAENKSLQKENNDLADEIRSLKEQLSTNADKLKSLENKIDLLSDDLSKVKGELKECENEKEKIKEEKESLLKVVENLKDEIKKLDDERNRLRASEESLKMNLFENEKKMDELRNENALLLKDNEKLTCHLNTLTEALENARNELREAEEADKARAEELENLRYELDKCRYEVVDLRKYSEKLKTDNEDRERQNADLRAAGDSAERFNADLRAQLDSLTSNNKKFAAELDSLNAEREQLKERLAQLGEKIDELEAEKAECEASLAKARDENVAANKELELRVQRIAELQNALSSFNGDKDRLERELGDLKWQLNKIKKDLDAELEAKNELQRQLANANAEIESLNAKVEHLKSGENAAEEFKSDAENARRELAQLKDELDKLQTVKSKELSECRAENERLKSKIGDRMSTESQTPWKLSSRERPPQKSSDDRKMQMKDDRKLSKGENNRKESADRHRQKGGEHGDDFLTASKMLKNEMQKQIEAVELVRQFISYVDGRIKQKPDMTAELSPSASGDKKWSAPEINELFERSRKLSDAIRNAEKEVQSLKNGSSALDELKDFSISTVKSAQKTVCGEEILGDLPNVFDANSWLQSLALTELAELHEKICQLTSEMVQDDGEEEEKTGVCACKSSREEQCDALNSRIAALQRRIAEKQREAAARADEMRRALAREQTQLLVVADEMNRQRERNLALYLSVEASTAIPSPTEVELATQMLCCAREDCQRAGCVGDLFDSIGCRK